MKRNADDPDVLSRSELKKKVLERWENEGGKLGAEVSNSSAPRKRNKRKSDRPRDLQPGPLRGK